MTILTVTLHIGLKFANHGDVRAKFRVIVRVLGIAGKNKFQSLLTAGGSVRYYAGKVNLMDSASRITPVGRINRELTVNGNTLEAGSLIYVLAESDDSLLVCVPDGEMKWRMGSGTVIQVDKSDVIWAPTLLQLKYKTFD